MTDKQQLRDEIREFLTTRRARVTPEEVGLPVFGSTRRVTGLRREEVATLAGISADYYTRLERGNVTGSSESVLDGISHALRLDNAERAHLADLVRAASGGARTARKRRPPQQRVRPAVQRILDALDMTPAFVVDSRMDILAANELGRALYAPIFATSVQPPNHARFLFLDGQSSEFWRQWEPAADEVVALLRASAGRDPYDTRLSDLIGELSTRSQEFRVRWAEHNVHAHSTGIKLIHHPVVGDLDLPFESTPLGDPGQHLLMYTAEPDSPSRRALELLASWTATSARTPLGEDEQSTHATDHRDRH